jgi:hypothetical protein
LDKRTVVFFRNTCARCFNDIEIPLLGDFAYGGFIFQTTDGQDFFIGEFIDNEAVEDVQEILNGKSFDLYAIMAQLADKKDNKTFSTTYPLCPNCTKRIIYYSDNNKTIDRQIDFAKWTDFQRKGKDEKRKIVLGLFNND